MNALPGGLEQSFRLAAGELGMCTASWLFARELGAAGGAAAVSQLRDELGRMFPVLHFVTSRWLEQKEPLPPAPDRVLEACAGADQLVVVGLEAMYLDALLGRLPGLRVSVLTESPFKVDWRRVLANLGSNVTGTELSSFQRLAGRRSVLLTFLYGRQGNVTHITPAWLRVMGPDVRTQFRTIIGWDVLGDRMDVYPRWLFGISTEDFTHLV